VVLTLDNFSGHGQLQHLQRIVPSWLKIEFLPENTTSVLQPMDGGIIARFKRFYRKLLLQRLIRESENPNLTVDGFKKSVNVLNACMMAAQAWDTIDADAIEKVWRRTLLVNNTLTITSEGLSKAKRVELESVEVQVRQALVNMSSAMAKRGGDEGDVAALMSYMGEDMVDDFLRLWLDFDEGGGDEVTIEEACDTVREQEGDEGVEEEPEVDVPTVMAHAEARRQLIALSRYFERYHADCGDVVYLDGLVDKVDKAVEENKVQKPITDFFIQV
jgi:hypothetical protein